MPDKFFNHLTTRREFLRRSGSGLGLIALGSVAPAFLTRSALASVPEPGRDRSILVLIQLAGGNDGLNTVVPFQDDNYHRLRPTLALEKADIHRLTDNLALHPACGPMAELHREGLLSIVQNVGYPNPNRSHFRSMEIWETASGSNEFLTTGWAGRFFDNCCQGMPEEPGSDPLGVSIGNDLPDVFLSSEDHNIFSLNENSRRAASGNKTLLDAYAHAEAPDGNAGYLQHTFMNALVTEQRLHQRLRDYRPAAAYPDTGLANKLRTVAGLIAAGLQTRVFFVSHGGFDTHAGQLNRHQQLLAELAGAMHAFQSDLRANKLDQQVLTMTFSEFGRRPSENASAGTDHGTAAPLFIMGSNLKGPIVGQAPDLNLRPNQDLTFSTDFRSVYATVLERWFQADSSTVLGEKFQPLPFI